jgi:AcrR family transcriptional regulator
VADVGDDVKRRPYRSDRRRDQAEQTRSRVVTAARDLFVAKGFDGTSVAAVADAAGVSAETVYAQFGTKRALLGEVAQRAVRGDETVPVPEQEGPRRVRAAKDQREQLALFAADVVIRIERAGPVVFVVAGAAAAHPELAELLERLHADRMGNLGGLVDALLANGPLRLTRARATETVWALSSPELHRILTTQRRWSRRRYVSWLAESLAELLVP